MLKITPLQEELLTIIKTFTDEWTPKQLLTAAPHIARGAIDTTLKRFIDLKLVEKVDFGIYKTPKNVLDGSLKYVISDRGTHIKKRGKAAPKVSTPPPAPVIQLSSTADKLANITSDVLKENSDLRNLLLQIHETIGNALELNTPEE